MKCFFTQCLLVLFCIAFVPTNVFAQLPEIPKYSTCQKDDSRIQVMLVGSYHMSNPGLDQFNLESDDVLLEKRQIEIAALVKRLAGFKPTKVAVEAPYGDQATFKRYTDYVEGKRKLRRSEEEQIGFRLANKLGHKTIYPIDVKLPLKNDGLDAVLKAKPKFGKNMGQLDKFGKSAISMMGNWLKENSIGNMLYKMNEPRFLKMAHLPYIWLITPVADGDNYGGADMVATWYQRNLRIFANLTRTAETGDRIFVIYGQGHIPTIHDFVDDSLDYCRVDPLPYLKDEGKSK